MLEKGFTDNCLRHQTFWNQNLESRVIISVVLVPAFIFFLIDKCSLTHLAVGGFLHICTLQSC